MLVAAVACAPPPAGFPDGTRAAVVVYGDSLVSESTAEIRERLSVALPGWDVQVRAYSGSAQCDWHGRMRQDGQDRPAVVVLAFFGNHLTPCAAPRPWPHLYTMDAHWAVRTWSSVPGTRLVFVGAPPRVGSASNPVAEAYRLVAGATGARFADSGWLFVGADGVAGIDAGCFVDEAPVHGCEAGRIRVRSLDEVHFCANWPWPCSGYSAGSHRYAEVIAAAAADAAGVGFPRRGLASPPTTTTIPDAQPGPEPDPDDGTDQGGGADTGGDGTADLP